MMQSPELQEEMKHKMEALKEDPELRPILEELEKGGPEAMTKFWNDPETLQKLGKAFEGTFDMSSLAGALPKQAGEGEEAEEGEVDEPALHQAAMNGEIDELKKLLAGGADPNEKDQEGRTALHFASGYGEMACMDELIAAKASMDAVDDDKNTALHYGERARARHCTTCARF